MLFKDHAHSNVMQTVTVRDFSGGWNVVDNDVNLSAKYAKVQQNIIRGQDGSNRVRFGTRLIADLGEQSPTEGVITANSLYANAGEFFFTMPIENHNLISGHRITISGAESFAGFTAEQINAEHIVTVVDEDTLKIILDTAATTSMSGGGTDMTFSHNNKKLSASIVNGIYFNDRNIIVDAAGTIAESNDVGVSRVIWNSDIAAKLIGTPTGWGAIDYCSFLVYNGELIVMNGIDKPVVINFNRSTVTASPCQYLSDAATGSNLNVPIAKYGTVIDNYVVFSGNPLDPTIVYIAEKGTSGTWYGDADTTTAVNVDVGKYAQSVSNIIRGLTRFRDKLLIHFDDVTVIGTLGVMTTVGSVETHTPTFNDTIDYTGCIAHRSIITLGDDALMCSNDGVPSVARSSYTDTLRPENYSFLIEPEIQKSVRALTVGAASKRIFAVYNRRESQYMLFIPNGDTVETTTETRGFIFTYSKPQKLSLWAEFVGWNWSAGWRSALGRVFFTTGKKIFVYGAPKEDEIAADFIDDTAFNADGTGVPITFAWEVPWSDMGQRRVVKNIKHIALETIGSASFNVKMFVDGIYYDPATGDASPLNIVTLAGSESEGYGLDSDGYGGVISSKDERKIPFNGRCNIVKLRFDGAIKKPLGFVSFSLMINKGGVFR